jgi:hypothetical protein
MRRKLISLGLAAVGVVVGGCGSGPPTQPALDPVVYEVNGFRIEDATRTAPRSLIDSIAAALGASVAQVTAALPEFTLRDDTITFQLLDGGGIPYVAVGDFIISQWDQDLALDYLPHQVTHLLTGYLRGPFLEEGIAVYVTEVVSPTSTITHPYRGQPPHAWVSLFEANGSTIPLATAIAARNLGFDYDGSSRDASAWQLFLEGGSFTRWVITRYGRDVWLDWYVTDDLVGALQTTFDDIERDWLSAVRLAYPNPLPCEEALETRAPLTSREEFWCARARGE